MKHIYLSLLLIFTAFCSYAQPGFRAFDSINVNNINASVMMHGRLWGKYDTIPHHSIYKPQCRFPKDSLTNINKVGGIWISGYDDSGRLHVATCEGQLDSIDFWPGPLDGSSSISYTASAQWATIWKVTRIEINLFRSLSTHTTANTPHSILYWPGAGNSYARGAGGTSLSVPVGREMAPFIDLNRNGVYEPLLGEYPDVKGDMALWWIFNDDGPKHNKSNGRPLSVEVHAMAYAYKRGTLIDNVIYYNYRVVNRSANNYSRMRLAAWQESGLGYPFDDDNGFDSSRRMGITYNGGPDGVTSSGGWPIYGASVPVAGITFVHVPGDRPGSKEPAGAFCSYSVFSIITLADIDTLADWGMRGPFQGIVSNDCQLDTLKRAKYMLPDDPSDTNGWSVCNCDYYVWGDNSVLSSNDNYLATGQTLDFTLALVTTNCSDSNYCPYVNFRGIKEVADTAWAVYEHPLWETGVEESAAPHPHATLYPNPAHNTLTLELDQLYIGEVSIRDIPGKAVRTLFINTPKTTIDISDLAPGTYVLTTNLKEQPSILFTKQ